MTLEEKLKEAQALSVKPVKLSDPEKEVLTNIISTLKEGLDQVLGDALKLPRDEAYKKINSYVKAMINAPDQRAPKKGREVEAEKAEAEPKEQRAMKHPILEDLLKELPEDKRARARIVLGCIKQYNKLEEMGEEGKQALCPECTPEKMLECINIEDPRVVVSVSEEIDREIEEAGVVRG